MGATHFPELDCAIKDNNKGFADNGHSDGIIPVTSASTARVTADNLKVASSLLEQNFPHLNKDIILPEEHETVSTFTIGAAAAAAAAAAWLRGKFNFYYPKPKSG